MKRYFEPHTALGVLTQVDVTGSGDAVAGDHGTVVGRQWLEVARTLLPITSASVWLPAHFGQA